VAAVPIVSQTKNKKKKTPSVPDYYGAEKNIIKAEIPKNIPSEFESDPRSLC
jgi:hypothetical protein